jgi:hypothetical protein
VLGGDRAAHREHGAERLADHVLDRLELGAVVERVELVEKTKEPA